MNVLPDHAPIESTLASHIIGLCLSFLSYGIMLCQGLQYYQRYWERDKWDLRLAVVGIVFGETVHSGLYAHIGYYYLVTNYGHPEALTGSVLINVLPPKFQTPLVVFVVAFVLFGLAFACGKEIVMYYASYLIDDKTTAFTGKLFAESTFVAFLKFRWLLSVAFAVSAVLDVFIATILSITLYKSQTGIKKTDALVRTLILYAFTTGTLTRQAD
ncbi:hypothetical protein C8Q74DRAFT_1363192 [Fomes fomentarius]|nr:hypothetical protein C8Q74DRAFT_1363192 [Fomes fomentarius]